MKRRSSSKGKRFRVSKVAQAMRRARLKSRRVKNRYFYAPHTRQPIGPALVKFLRAQTAKKRVVTVVPVSAIAKTKRRGSDAIVLTGGHPRSAVAPYSYVGAAYNAAKSAAVQTMRELGVLG